MSGSPLFERQEEHRLGKKTPWPVSFRELFCFLSPVRTKHSKWSIQTSIGQEDERY